MSTRNVSGSPSSESSFSARFKEQYGSSSSRANNGKQPIDSSGAPQSQTESLGAFGKHRLHMGKEAFEELYSIIEQGDIQLLIGFYEKYDVEMDVRFEENKTPLHIAAAKGHCAMIRKLMELKAPKDAQDARGTTPLAEAVRNDQGNAVSTLLAYNVDKDLGDADTNTPFSLCFSGKRSFTSIARILFDAGAIPNTPDKKGKIPLHDAAGHGLWAWVEFLVEYQLSRTKMPNVDVQDYKGITPFHCAARGGHFEVMSLLEEKGANIDLTTSSNLTSLHFAAMSGEEKCLKKVCCPAIINFKDSYGNTPLHKAASSGKCNSITVLLQKGALIDPVNGDHNTPLHLAALKGHASAVDILLKYGADKDAANDRGETPLHLAVGNVNGADRPATVEVLLKAGANARSVDDLQQTALHKVVMAQPSQSRKDLELAQLTLAEAQQILEISQENVRNSRRVSKTSEERQEYSEKKAGLLDELVASATFVQQAAFQNVEELSRKDVIIAGENYEIVRKLIRYKARVNAGACHVVERGGHQVIIKNVTPLHLAADDKIMGELLKSMWADPSIKDSEGKKPYQYATIKERQTYLKEADRLRPTWTWHFYKPAIFE